MKRKHKEHPRRTAQRQRRMTAKQWKAYEELRVLYG